MLTSITSLNPESKESGREGTSKDGVRIMQVKPTTQYISAQSIRVFTFDLHQHEVLVWHGAVVGHLLGYVDAAQTHTAEVFFTGQTRQSSLRVFGGFIHWNEKERVHIL